MRFSIARASHHLFGFGLTAVAAAVLAACGQQGETVGSSGRTHGSTGAGGSSASGSGGSGPSMPIVVMDWNVHNFFNAVNDSSTPTPSDEIIYTTTEYAQKRQEIASVITPLDPDLVMFAEVEHQSVLDDLNGDLGGAYPTRVLIEGNDPRGLDVGVVSKLPFDSVKSHKDDAFTRLDLVGGDTYHYSRDCLEVHLTYNGRKVVFLGVHYRSKVSPDDPDKRIAEAQHTRQIADDLLKADPSSAVVILGDFNDTPDSIAVQWTLNGGSSSGSLFHDAPTSVTSADRWTYDFSGSHELIDHQVSSPTLATMLDGQTVSIPHTSGVAAASDHAPIIATYDVR